jgi:hypothetical protein
VPGVKAENLRAVLRSHVDPANTHLHTDQSLGYRKIAGEFASHTTVNHNIGRYVLDGAGTNQAETFFSQLKRSIDGTHHHVSREHLERYLAEFDFRYSTCKLTDTKRMDRMAAHTGGRRLTYREPVGA